MVSEEYKLECSANSEFEGSVKSLAAATIRIYRSCRLEMEFCSALLEHELLQNPDPNSLWRGKIKFLKIFINVFYDFFTGHFTLIFRQFIFHKLY